MIGSAIYLDIINYIHLKRPLTTADKFNTNQRKQINPTDAEETVQLPANDKEMTIVFPYIVVQQQSRAAFQAQSFMVFNVSSTVWLNGFEIVLPKDISHHTKGYAVNVTLFDDTESYTVACKLILHLITPSALIYRTKFNGRNLSTGKQYRLNIGIIGLPGTIAVFNKMQMVHPKFESALSLKLKIYVNNFIAKMFFSKNPVQST